MADQMMYGMIFWIQRKIILAFCSASIMCTLLIFFSPSRAGVLTPPDAQQTVALGSFGNCSILSTVGTMMSMTDDAKGMIAQEERELRRVFDHLASYRQKKKTGAAIAAAKERRARLEASKANPDVSALVNEKGVKMTREEMEEELRKVDFNLEKYAAEVTAIHSNPSKHIKNDDLFDAIKSLGKLCSKKEISDMIWEADENLDGVVDWEELRAMFNRNLIDKTELEPVNLFNVVQFMTYDKKNSGTITADDTMAILFARYGQAQLEMRMKQLFGDSDELSFVNFLDRVGKQRRMNADARAKN